jgi:predicted dehydrogenase
MHDRKIVGAIGADGLQPQSRELLHHWHSEPVNLMLIGLGAHAMFMYYPIMEEFAATENVRFSYVVDLETKRQSITNYLSQRSSKPDDIYLLDEDDVDLNDLPVHVIQRLDDAVRRFNISGVVISTEPLAHIVYAKWALKRNLPILMDKPISSKDGVSHSVAQAKALISDYSELAELYKHAQTQNPRCFFSIMAQRRFHPAFIKVRELVKEVFEKTGCPITSMVTEHSDGEWRLPTEIINGTYHPYNQGYGVFSHSGYHSLDTMLWLIETAQDTRKFIDNVDVFINVSRPSDYIGQITLEDFVRLFGEQNAAKFNSLSENSFFTTTKRFGEMDGFASFNFKRGEQTMTLVSTNLMHNSFSQRAWITTAGQNLYKGNGRVRHESYHIQQGPFQAIKLVSFQSRDHSSAREGNIFDVGGDHHLDIHVFRNCNMFPEWNHLQTLTVRDLGIDTVDGIPLGHQGVAKKRGVTEYIRCISGEIPRNNINSDLLSHRRATLLLSGVYQSAAHRLLGENPVINISFD